MFAPTVTRPITVEVSPPTPPPAPTPPAPPKPPVPVGPLTVEPPPRAQVPRRVPPTALPTVPPVPATAKGRFVVLNFDNADIETVVHAASEIVGFN